MNHRRPLTVVLFLLLLLLLVSVSCGGNNPPEISSLSADPETIAPGSTCTITCTASDTDGDSLTYSWSEDGWSIEGSGSSVL